MPTTRPKTRALLLLLGLAVGLVAALAAWAKAGTTYTAEASIQVLPLTSTPTDEKDPTDQISMRTEAKVAGSQELAAAVAARHGMDTDEFQRGLQVTNPTDTTILDFNYTSDDPAEAAELANAVADAYLVARADRSEASIGSIRKSLDAQIKDLQTRFDAVAEDLRDADVAEQPIFEAQLTAITDQTIAVTTELSRITSLIATPGVKLASPTPPESPSSPSLFVWLALGLAGGAILGVLLVWMWSLRDDRLPRARREADAAQDAHAAGSAGDRLTIDPIRNDADSSQPTFLPS